MDSEEILRIYRAYVDLESLNDALIRQGADADQQQLKLLDLLEQSDIKRRHFEELASRRESELARLLQRLQNTEETNKKISIDLRTAEAQIAYLESEKKSLNVENSGLKQKFSFARRLVAESTCDDQGEESDDSGCITEEEEEFAPKLMSTRLECADLETEILEINVRTHNFTTFSATVHACDFCGDLIAFNGRKALKCTDCHMRIHGKCNIHVRLPCTPRLNGVKIADKRSLDIADFCSPSLKVAFPVVHCVAAMEVRGLNFDDLYRNPSNDSEVKKLFNELVSSRPFPKMDSHHATTISGCLMKFLSSLRHPLIPLYKLNSFTKTSSDLKNSVKNLPQENRHTLAYICHHFLNILGETKVEIIAHHLAPCVVAVSPLKQPNEARNQSVDVLCALLKLEKSFWRSVVTSP